MATIQGASIVIQARGGTVSLTAYYDSITGKPVRVELSNTTPAPYRVRLVSGTREFSAVIQAGSTSFNVTGALANSIDMRRYGDDLAAGELPGANPTNWMLALEI